MKQAAAVPMLEVEGLDACYGTSQALFGMSLTVHAGETLALLGRNGAGKSTTMKAVAGIVPARAGSIRLRGTEIRGRPPHAIARAGIGFVPEDRQIFADLSVVDNLLIAAKAGVDMVAQQPAVAMVVGSGIALAWAANGAWLARRHRRTAA